MAFYNPYKKDDEKVTQPNFGGVRSVSFTDPTTINRQRALADSLRQQSITPLNMGTAGGYVIPPSPMQGIAKLGEAALAVFAEKKAREKEEANKQLRSDAVAKALRLQQEGVADTIQPPSIPLSAQSSGGSYVPPTQEIRRKPTQTEVLGALAEGGPDMEKLIAESQIKNLLADASGTGKGSFGKTPQIIRMPDGTLRLFQVNDRGEGKLTEMPEGAEGAEVVRNLVKIDRGGEVGLYNPLTSEEISTIDKTLDPKDQPENIKEIEDAKIEAKVKEIKETTEPEADKQQQIEESKVIGKNIATVRNDLAEFEANLPRLQEVVEELGALADIATYTEVGLGVDALKRQAGMDVGKGAIARKEYISKVDNEILPLLRQTFGAQFTVQEGETLKRTLGDPNASPEEKKAVLKSFIENKIAQIEIKRRLLEQITGGKDLSMEELMEKYKEEEE